MSSFKSGAANEKKSRLPQNAFIRKHAQIIYAIILIILIPLIIIANSLFVIRKFQLNLNVQLQRQALIIAELIDATIVTSESELDQIQATLTHVFEGPEEISSIDIMVPNENEEYRIVASRVTSNIGETVTGANNSLAWLNDQPIAHLTKPSADDIARDPALTNESYWNVVSPLHNDTGDKIALLNLKMSRSSVDAVERQTLIGSYALLIGTLVIVVLLIFVNTRFFEYAILFRKLQEVDEMKDEFISMASHELRAPIAAINGYVVMFIEGGLGTFNEAGEKGLKIVRASIQRLGNLVEDLLDVSRIEQNRIDLTLKPLKIQNVIKQTLDEQKIQADAKGIELKYISRADWQPVYADSDKLRQILVNLIGNAIKYTKNGSVQIDVDDAGSHVKVKIKDTGIGISAANREHLFDKFYRVKNEQTKGIVGTGLGLWITKRLIELMGGKIFVDSIENVGTEFSFTIKKASPTA